MLNILSTMLNYGAIDLPNRNRRGFGVEQNTILYCQIANYCRFTCQFNGKIIRPNILLKYTTFANRFEYAPLADHF